MAQVWLKLSVNDPTNDPTIIMGVLNVTPDSFYDGGRYVQPKSAITRAVEMEQQGADLIDVGGESTRPGAEPVPEHVELNRVLPVVKEIVSELNIPVSVDTYKSAVAAAVLEAGASFINDITGLRKDPDMASVIASFGAGVIIMHSQGDPKNMQDNPTYRDVVDEVRATLETGCDLALKAGIAPERIWIDPGFGFGKTVEHNLELLRRLGELKSIGFPIMVGTSNKSMIGQVLGVPVGERGEGTAATVAASIIFGAHGVRVHDVLAMRRVAQMTDAIMGKSRR